MWVAGCFVIVWWAKRKHFVRDLGNVLPALVLRTKWQFENVSPSFRAFRLRTIHYKYSSEFGHVDNGVENKNELEGIISYWIGWARAHLIHTTEIIYNTRIFRSSNGTKTPKHCCSFHLRFVFWAASCTSSWCAKLIEENICSANVRLLCCSLSFVSHRKNTEGATELFVVGWFGSVMSNWMGMTWTMYDRLLFSYEAHLYCPYRHITKDIYEIDYITITEHHIRPTPHLSQGHRRA